MESSRRRFLAAAAAFPAILSNAWAQAYPTRPVRLLVGFQAGGVGDIVARVIGQWLSERLGQPVIVENRTGAGTNIATEAVLRAPADGYTLLLATSANAINAALYEKLNFDFVRDSSPIASIADSPLVMEVNPAFAAKTVTEFIAYAKANPGMSMASGGVGSPNHIAGELFKMMTGVDMVHVPYRGDAPAIADLIAGQVQIYFGTLGGSIEYIKAGKLRALAISTAMRSAALPNVMTLGDTLPGYEASAWQGLVAPKNTPAEIIERLNKEVNAALGDPRIKSRFADLGLTLLPASQAEFGTFITAETKKWGKVVKTAGMKAD